MRVHKVILAMLAILLLMVPLTFAPNKGPSIEDQIAAMIEAALVP